MVQESMIQESIPLVPARKAAKKPVGPPPLMVESFVTLISGFGREDASMGRES
jgi:hypothetical protein